ncbi:MAG: lysophospholipid acyltransferase family protein [Myxococcota bacterium]
MSSLSWQRRAFWRFCWFIYMFTFWPLFRTRYIGRENIPSEGPLLLLSNHTSLMDPPHVAWGCWRIVHFMATEQLFRAGGFVRWLVTNLNAFPKAKGVRDRRAMMALVRRYRGGDIVNMYPEGERTWSGRLLPIVPNTPKMLKRLKARVVYARIKTGHLIQPRWAVYPRWVPVEVEYSPVFVYDDPDRSEEDILKEMEAQLRIEPETINAGLLSFGFRMAHGLPNYLWACPECFSIDALKVAHDDHNAILCSGCGCRWQIDVSQRMLSQTPGVEDLRVVTAHDRIVAHFGTPPVQNREEFEQTGVVLSCLHMRVGRIHFGVKEPEAIATGQALLTAERIGVYDETGEALWERELTDLKAVLSQLGGVFHVRTKDETFQLDPEGQSPVKWFSFTKQHWKATQPDG